MASLHVSSSYGPDDVILKVVSVNQSPAQGGGGRKMMAEVGCCAVHALGCTLRANLYQSG